MSREKNTRRQALREQRKILHQPPWRHIRHMDRPAEQLGAEGVDLVLDCAFRILEEVGVAYLLDDAVETMRQHGAEISAAKDQTEKQVVKMDRHLVMELMAHAPSSFKIYCRNPERTITLGENYVNFAPVGSPPFAWDMEKGRRTGNYEDYKNFLRLSQAMNVIHLTGGYMVEPADLHASVRHLYALRDKVLYTDKVFHHYSLGLERTMDGLEIARISRRLTWERMAQEPSTYTNINSSSPLRLDNPMLIGMRECARRGQPVICTPFTLAGAMAPITMAGAVAQQTAEALAGMVYCQAVRPGAPVVFGGFTPNVDMKTGAPAFGTPEYMKSSIATGEIARRLGVPYRSSNATASKLADAQGAWESVFSLWGAFAGQAHLIYHGAGWLEGGLLAGFEKFMVDCELLSTLHAFLDPLELTPEALALEAIREVGHQGHFFGIDHTQSRFETAFWRPMLADWRNFEAWEEAGSLDTMTRAHQFYKRVLKEFEPPPLDPAVKEELCDFVDRRIREGGAPTDF